MNPMLIMNTPQFTETKVLLTDLLNLLTVLNIRLLKKIELLDFKVFQGAEVSVLD
jgi:hypothetical protein